MKIGEPLLWLGPYLQIAATVVPKVKNITLLRVLNHKKKDIQRIDASIIKRKRGFTLNFYCKAKIISKTEPKVVFQYVAYSKIDILINLAHEIAHIEHWKHSPEHKILEAKLTILFMARLKQEGYISTEEELANIRQPC